MDGSGPLSGERHECEVLIVGGGLVGSVLAHALTRVPLTTVLVESRNPRALEQPSFDSRATALAAGSQRILAALSLWDELRRDAEPIDSIHVSEQGRFGAVRIRARDEGVPALGYTIENRVLGRVLWERLAHAERLTCVAPARLVSLEARDGGWLARVEDGARRIEVRAGLLAAADGARSVARTLLGIPAREDRYGQRAVIFNCRMQAPHEGRAFERFSPSGPLALLPLGAARMSVVWTMREREAEDALQRAPEELRHRLQEAFGWRLGRVEEIGAPSLHELARVRSAAPRVPRAVLIGNAAVSLHPVAGQGFNLALRDVAALAEVLADAVASGENPGAAHVLGRYHAWRAADRRLVASFTHNLIKLFGIQAPAFGTLRGLALAAFDVAPGAKGLLARHSMGLAGRLPRLARGADLGVGG